MPDYFLNHFYKVFLFTKRWKHSNLKPETTDCDEHELGWGVYLRSTTFDNRHRCCSKGPKTTRRVEIFQQQNPLVCGTCCFSLTAPLSLSSSSSASELLSRLSPAFKGLSHLFPSVDWTLIIGQGFVTGGDYLSVTTSQCQAVIRPTDMSTYNSRQHQTNSKAEYVNIIELRRGELPWILCCLSQIKTCTCWCTEFTVITFWLSA